MSSGKYLHIERQVSQVNIRKLDHVALVVKDVERTRHFYGQILGLEEVARPHTFGFPGAWFEHGGQQIHIIGEDTPGRTTQVNPGYNRDELARGHCSHFAFEVDDLDEAVHYLKSQHIEIVGGPRPRGDGVMQLYICDPDNYVVEIFA